MALQELTSYYISLSGATAEKNCCVASALKVLFQREVQKSTDSEYKKTVAVVVAVVVAAIFSSLLLPRKFWVSSEGI